MSTDKPKIIPDFNKWAQSCFAMPDKETQINCVIIALKDAFLMGSTKEPLPDDVLEKYLKIIYPTEILSRIDYERGYRDAEEGRLLVL